MKDILLAVAFLVVLITVTGIFIDSDSSDSASSLPTVDVYRTSTDASLSGNGAILDGALIDFDTTSDSSGNMKFIVREGTVIISGTTYMRIGGSSDGTFTLYGNMFGKSEFLLKTGVLLSLYTDRFCTGEPVVSAELPDMNRYYFGSGLEVGVNYYIKVTVLHTEAFDSAPTVKGVGFSLTIENLSMFVVNYVDEDGTVIDKKALVNGSKFVFPDVTKEGYTLLGWYTSYRDDAVLYRTIDTVELDRDLTLYARWWKGVSEEAEFSTPSGTVVKISVDVDTSGPDVSLTLNIKAENDEGDITINLVDVDLTSPGLVIPISLALDPDSPIFTYAKSEQIVELYGAVSSWIEEHAVIPTTFVLMGDNGTVLAEPKAFENLASHDIDFSIVGDYGNTMDLSPEVLHYLYGKSVEYGFDTDLIMVENRPATIVDINDSQSDRIGDDFAWVFSIKIGGIPITDLKYPVKFTLNYSPEKEGSQVKVYYIDENGYTKEVSYTYSDGKIVAKTTHLPLFTVKEVHTDNSLWILWGILLFALMEIIWFCYHRRNMMDQGIWGLR